MSELLRVQCQQGQLIITEDRIIVEVPGKEEPKMMLRSSLTETKSQVASSPFLRLTKGTTDLTFYGQKQETLWADGVQTPAARNILALLQHK